MTETTMTDVPATVKREIVNQEIELYKNTRYQAQLRYRVQQAISADETVLDSLRKDMIKIEQILDVLQGELNAIGA